MRILAIRGLAGAVVACLSASPLLAQAAPRAPLADTGRRLAADTARPGPAADTARRADTVQRARRTPVVASVCDPGALRTCNSVQIAVQPLSRVPFESFTLVWRNHPGFGGPFTADPTAGAADLSPRQSVLVADPQILSGYAIVRAMPLDMPHLLLSMRGGRGRAVGRAETPPPGSRRR